ncbi:MULTISPECIES: hypothetical protein [unclassified Ensifer]|uniref:hypothetical protein n=1 Tax=unclassified Ensifer TaxID=2633371 RepID=UPI00081362D0|nr:MULTISPECIES: hypothetical protein [unclassified Ensifer]OCP01131.1 hypothetical protein BC362_21990 [Ensifer sp. LC14]OCP05393.1 hypothetical protein BBX50_24200 [Ensifer sp. LC11]OCP06005.1 hypothetical protein BC374_24420 [Ensifer sp. LC13]OCP30828.1 hypothetical protein BC364_24050 [Ensifer sp. LC499]
MNNTPNGIDEPELRPLLSPRFVYRVTAIVVLLAGLSAAIALAGRWFGENLAFAGHTASTEVFDIFIGQDHMRLPANMIRFEAQRATSIVERVDVYLTWPALEGYNDDNRKLFNDVDAPQNLIFLQISQSTMSRDMSGRLEPIYTQVFDGAPIPGPSGLKEHTTKATSSYAGEVFYTADRDGRPPYVVRCLKSDAQTLSTSADCQRDIHAGTDLAVLYRFSNKLLPQWQEIDDAMAAFIKSRLVP